MRLYSFRNKIVRKECGEITNNTTCFSANLVKVRAHFYKVPKYIVENYLKPEKGGISKFSLEDDSLWNFCFKIDKMCFCKTLT